MAAQLGRNMLVKLSGTAIASVKETSLKVNKQAIDISSKTDNGFRVFHDAVGSKSLDISCEGVAELNAVRTLAIDVGDNILLSGVTLDYEGGPTISGTFALVGYSESGPNSDVVNCSFELQSSGPWTIA